jgi:glycosyltransferase involved in cell wall biosynthesis
MAATGLSIVALSPYHGGPRQAFLEALAAHSAHDFLQLTLPPRTWPWRLKGSALYFAAEIARLRRRKIDLILADDLVDTARLRALLPQELRRLPIVQYFHDDCLGLNLRERSRDEPLALAQLYSILASRTVLVASDYHRQSLLNGSRRLIDSWPDAVPVNLLEALGQRIRVMPPGIDASAIAAAKPRPRPQKPPVILWNHPWVDEQNPRMFFETLYHLEQEGLDFRLIAVGAAVRKYPEIFQDARNRLSRHVIQFGYVPGRDQYLANIRAADVVVSTATNEWFPLATIEATVAGAFPLVGRGLANGEVFGEALAEFSYRGPVDLRRRLSRLLAEPAATTAAAESLGHHLAARFDWAARAKEFDALFAAVLTQDP